MSPISALNHVANLLLPALSLGSFAALLAKLVWRRELRTVAWVRLATWASLGGVLASVAGLLLSGRDGGLWTYCAMVLAASLALFWVGFGLGRR